MQANEIDLERIRAVLADVTGAGGQFSQRGLSKLAGETRDCVGDIINGRNKNPTIKVLSNLAMAMDADLSVFGIVDARPEAPTEAELEDALRDMLPGMPRGSLDTRARYLAEAVARALKLPPGQRQRLPGSASDHAADVPPLAPTN